MSLCLGWLLAYLAATSVVEQFCLVATIIVLVWGTLGNNVARSMLMPLVFLLFAVPFGEAFVPKLQDFSAWFAVKMLDLCNIPVLLEGRFISVPSGKWEVAEACSGLRFLTASLPVGFLFAGLVYRKWVRRIGFFVVSAVVPILANAVRVFGIVLLAYVSGNRIATGVDHIVYGWIFFAAVMALLLAVGGWWREPPDLGTHTASLPATKVSDNEDSKAGGRRSATVTIVFACCSVAAISIAPVSAKVLWVSAAQSPRFDLISPATSLPLQIASTHMIGWKPEFLTPNAELTQAYQIKDQPIELYVAYYAADEPDAKLVSSTNTLFDRNLWSRINEDDVEATVEGQRFRVHETLIRSSERSVTVWSLYWVDGTYTSSEIAAKLLWMKARFLRNQRGAAIIAIAAENRPGHIPAAEILRQFLEHISLRRTLTSKSG